ncbi:hypothetical protein XELAEV_18042241mg [Xenopus laevis]|uniref:Uncharacterized protein n=1 Tax=Xenopus laevis TaxID=8355 RepID=A0A974H5W6_XENLA|nr:hypothetical protein XELAEV_18042241mg [Xenopus laevis]
MKDTVYIPLSDSIRHRNLKPHSSPKKSVGLHDTSGWGKGFILRLIQPGHYLCIAYRQSTDINQYHPAEEDVLCFNRWG